MVFRVFAVLPAVLLLCGGVSGQEKFPGFSNGGFGFGPGFEQAETVDLAAELIQLDARTVELRVRVTPPGAFYIYSMNTPFGYKTKISVSESAGLQLSQQGFTPDHPPKTEFSEGFNGEIEKFPGPVTWSARMTSATPLTGSIQVRGSLKGQICTTGEGGRCVLLSPAPEFSAELVADPSLPAVADKSTETRNGPPAPDGELLRYRVSMLPASIEPGSEVTVSVQATVADGWHTYASSMSDSTIGAAPTRIRLGEITGLSAVDEAFFTAAESHSLENPLGGDPLQVHSGTVTWTRRFKVTGPNPSVAGVIHGQVCNEVTCQLPGEWLFVVKPGDEDRPAVTEGSGGGDVAPVQQSVEGPVIQSATLSEAKAARQEGLLGFLLAAVSAGFVALLTPCVFPMIPVTVAFFLKQEESGQGNTKLLALIYCLGIVGTFTVIGVLATVIFGPQVMQQLANDPWLNLFFAAVFVAFALMLMGVFEFRVPGFLVNWSAKREGQGGLIGVLFMAFTFTLVSFTCTVAFVSTILIWASKGDLLWPTLGMLAFSTAFASPFFFLAMFPSWLSRLPKSGGWMQKVKCTAGLVELAFVVKFLSVADIGFSPTATPRMIDFSTAMVLWATLAFVTGMYLLGVFRFAKDTPTDGVSPVGALWAMGSIGLGLLICVGLFSPVAPDNWMWNRLEGFAPPRFGLLAAGPVANAHGVQDDFSELQNAQYAMSHDGLAYSLRLDEAIGLAQQKNRPIFVDFTGVNCINCRDMEKSVLNQAEVLRVLSTLSRAQLFLDQVPGLRDGPESQQLLKENSEISLRLTGAAAMPAYVVLSPDGKTVMSRASGVVSQTEFEEFLDQGIRRFEAGLAGTDQQLSAQTGPAQR